MHKNTHYTIPYKKSYFFKDKFFILQQHFCFCFTLEVEGVLFFLMTSCSHQKFETKDYDVAFWLEKKES